MVFLLVSVIFFVVVICSFGANGAENDSEIRYMLRNMLKDYDPKLRPDYLGPPVIVRADATILSFTNLDAINMMYTVDMFFRQRWVDHRLKHSLNETLTIIVGTKHPSDIIWTPDTVFINSVTSSMHHVTVNNHKLDIYPDGSVFWGTRVTVSPACILDLKAYPMDLQECHFEIVSYAYDSRHLKYKWKKPGVLIKAQKMAQFQLKSHYTLDKEFSYVAGNYTVLLGIFHFERLMGFAILQIYVPSIAVVCVSWISLWIRRNATPARVALCITTLLTISTIWASVNAQLPRVNYVKAIDIFMMTSFCCVIFTLLEYTLVLNSYKVLDLFRRRHKKRSPSKEDQVFLLNSGTFPSSNVHQPSFNNNDCSWPSSFTNQMRHRYDTHNDKRDKNKAKEKKKPDPAQKKKEEEENERLAERIEIFARVFFPLAYAIFNAIYWITYLKMEHVHG